MFALSQQVETTLKGTKVLNAKNTDFFKCVMQYTQKILLIKSQNHLSDARYLKQCVEVKVLF